MVEVIGDFGLRGFRGFQRRALVWGGLDLNRVVQRSGFDMVHHIICAIRDWLGSSLGVSRAPSTHMVHDLGISLKFNV